ncbi:hypothetical protein AHF37_09642 [Paragonimus kellicotti]|nr:hypothetical protein AHF37_09642 [Paragonimus kellicotti]
MVGPQFRPFDAAIFDHHYKALHYVLEKLRACSSRTAVACVNSIIAFAPKIVERATTGLPLYDFPIGSSTSSMKPRWVKKPGTGLPCGYCGDSVRMDSYRCDADQLIFHHECIQMADISECPFCGNQLRPQSPVPSTSAIVCTSSVIMKAMSGISPATDVDVDGPAEHVASAVVTRQKPKESANQHNRERLSC